MTFRPAPVDSGYQIKRTDLPGSWVIKACAENVRQTQRSTVLSSGDNVEVGTVEHALAALYACEIDNCLIEVDAPEFPILDGNAVEYVSHIEWVGYVEQAKERIYYVPDKKIEYIDPATGSHLILLPCDTLVCMYRSHSIRRFSPYKALIWKNCPISSRSFPCAGRSFLSKK